jgi:hypothetical protein
MNSLATTVITQSGQLLDQAIQGGGANTVSTNGLTVTQTATAQIMVTGGETISATGSTVPSYTWTQPAGGTLNTTVGDTVTATFNATGTYQVVVNESPDSVTQTCTVTIPATQ